MRRVLSLIRTPYYMCVFALLFLMTSLVCMQEGADSRAAEERHGRGGGRVRGRARLHRLQRTLR